LLGWLLFCTGGRLGANRAAEENSMQISIDLGGTKIESIEAPAEVSGWPRGDNTYNSLTIHSPTK
jgi:hypothetical protein